MADDIDATIRILRKNGNTTSVLGIAMLDAADEIERLQDEIERRNGLLIMIEARDAEIERLQRWKDEAMQVLGDWEAMFNALFVPDATHLGRTKATVVFKEITRLRQGIDALLAEIDTDHACTDLRRLCGLCGAADGSWPCVHRMALDELKKARRG